MQLAHDYESNRLQLSKICQMWRRFRIDLFQHEICQHHRAEECNLHYLLFYDLLISIHKNNIFFIKTFSIFYVTYCSCAKRLDVKRQTILSFINGVTGEIFLDRLILMRSTRCTLERERERKKKRL